MKVDQAVIKFARLAYRFFAVRPTLRTDLYQQLTDWCEADDWTPAENLVEKLEAEEARLHAQDVAAEKAQAFVDAKSSVNSAFGGTYERTR